MRQSARFPITALSVVSITLGGCGFLNGAGSHNTASPGMGLFSAHTVDESVSRDGMQVAGSGARPARVPLTQAEILLIREWIDTGVEDY